MLAALRMIPIALALAVPVNGHAGDAPITVTHAWARATPAGATAAAVYLTVATTGAADRLTGGSTAIAATTALHQSKTVGGVTTMRPLDGLDLAAGHPLTLAPGGVHLMLGGLTHQLVAGERFQITLNFATAGAIPVTVTVESLSGADPHDAMPGMAMPD